MTNKQIVEQTAREIVGMLVASVGFETGTSWEKIVRSKIMTMLKRMKAKK